MSVVLCTSLLGSQIKIHLFEKAPAANLLTKIKQDMCQALFCSVHYFKDDYIRTCNFGNRNACPIDGCDEVSHLFKENSIIVAMIKFIKVLGI